MLKVSAFFLISKDERLFLVKSCYNERKRQYWGHLMKKLLFLVIYLCISVIMFSCSNIDSEGGPDELPLLNLEDGQSEIEAGQLTAGEWNDIEHFDFYLSLFDETNQNAMPFYELRNHTYFQIRQLLKIQVLFEQKYVPYIEVLVQDEVGETLYQGITDVFGKVYFFPSEDEMAVIKTIQVSINDTPFIYEDIIERHTVITLDAMDLLPSSNIIDLMIVFDTTGSMGDELAYLQAEIEDVILRIQADLEDVIIRLAFLFYRDVTDDYITRCFNFSTDIDLQLNHFKSQSAGGGGDFPEASERALYEAIRKDWTDGPSTKLILHVADAPPHPDPESMTMFKEVIMAANKKGIKIIPIASSGIDKETEFLMRAEAMLTGGTYVFLTNHSGIGNEKIEPSVGIHVVEYLNDLLVRLIKTYHTGEIFDKIPYDQQNNENNS